MTTEEGRTGQVTGQAGRRKRNSGGLYKSRPVRACAEQRPTQRSAERSKRSSAKARSTGKSFERHVRSALNDHLRELSAAATRSNIAQSLMVRQVSVTPKPTSLSAQRSAPSEMLILNGAPDFSKRRQSAVGCDRHEKLQTQHKYPFTEK